METISFKKETLNEFIHSDKFSQLENIPISKHRAYSQINNPRIEEEDVILVAQFDENLTTGYLGILPDYVFVDGKKEKVGWLTCFWVHPDYKSKNVAANLFLRVIKAWKQQIFITNIVPWLEPVYQKTKIFNPTQYKIGYRGYLRFNLAEILPPKSTFFQKTKCILKASDKVLNLLADLRFTLKGKSKTSLRHEYMHCIDHTMEAFISNHKSTYWPQRGASEIDWIYNNPWIIEGAEEDYNSKRYYFSSLSKTFINQLIKFTDNSGKLVGVVFLNVREKRLHVPFIFIEDQHVDEISLFIFNKMMELKLNMITVFNNQLVSSFKQIKTPFLFQKSITKPYFISKKIEQIDVLYFQDGDGDCSFY